ncbi:MAG TPA: BTAD domain-containing putative transcriptional regulator [Candidatus Baltobacteraceae bacterium]|nr:BTAD domain-containing putative transcriptional regulator [Candidatus Baltobacteraceae bacterium]
MAGTDALVALLGAPALVGENGSRPLQASEKTVALLALLVCNADRPLSRAWLAAQLWPDAEEAEGRTNLRRHFYNLAKALPQPVDGAEPFVLSKNTAQWNRGSHRVDVLEFHECAAAGDATGAVQLYRGPLCLGVQDEAIAADRMKLEQTYTHLLERELEDAAEKRDLPRRIAAAHRLVQLDPLNERAARELALAHYESGDRPAAVRDLSAIGARIRAELEAEPEAQTLELLNKLLERAEAAPQSNLPLYATSLIGRESEPEQIAASLKKDRFVTLTGPGGIGKTRLAVFCARALLPAYEDGAAFLDLAGSRSTADVVAQIASVLQISTEGREASAAVFAALAERTMLLLADNCEQLDEDIAAFFERLLAQTRVHVLATSRRRLNLTQEAVIGIAPLQTPPAQAGTQDISRVPAVRLFLERAALVAPGLRITHENALHFRTISKQLDGLPLAIELVAARANLLTMEGIAKKLAAGFEAFSGRSDTSRHATVAAALQWSYDLLDESERLLLERLSVFAGRFDLEACERICSDAQTPPERIFDLLSELVESSLVVASEREDGQCYSLLVPVRAFLLKKITSQEEALRERHAAYYLSVAAHFAKERDRIGNPGYIRALRGHEANLDAAVRFYSDRSDRPALARIFTYLGGYWHYTGSAARHAALFDELLADYENRGLGQAETAELTGELARWLSHSGDWKAAGVMHVRSAELHEAAGERWRAIMARSVVAHADSYVGASLADEIVPRIEQLLKDLEAVPDAPAWLRARLMYDIGAMRGHTNPDDPLALEYLTESLRVMREEHRIDYEAAVLSRFGMIYHRRGNVQAALQFLSDDLIDALVRNDIYSAAANTLRTRANFHCELGNMRAAAADALRALEYLERAYEERFIFYTLTSAARILISAGRSIPGLHVLGYLRASVARSTFRFDALDLFEEEEVRALRDSMGAQFEEHLAFGASLRLSDVRNILRAFQAADALEDDLRTIAS